MANLFAQDPYARALDEVEQRVSDADRLTETADVRSEDLRANMDQSAVDAFEKRSADLKCYPINWRLTHYEINV